MNRASSQPHPLTLTIAPSSASFDSEFNGSEMVIIQQQANLIHKRLEDAEARLRALSINSQSSIKLSKKGLHQSSTYNNNKDQRVLRIPASFHQTSRLKRSPKKLVLNEDDYQLSCRQGGGYSNTSTRGVMDHFEVIRVHLQELEKQVQTPDYQYYETMYNNTLEQLETLRADSELRIRSLQDKIEEQVTIINQHEEQNSVLFKRVEQLEERLKTQEEQYLEQLRDYKINTENKFLVQKDQLLDQIDQLSAQLEETARADNNITQRQNHVLHSEIERYREQANIQRGLKVDAINKTRELQSENRLLRSNNQRFLQELNEVKPELQKLSRDTLSVCELLLHGTEFLNRINNNELSGTLVLVKEEYNLKKQQIRSLMTDIRAKNPNIVPMNGSVGGTTLGRGSGLFKYQQSGENNKLKKFIDGKQNYQDLGNNIPKTQKGSFCNLQQQDRWGKNQTERTSALNFEQPFEKCDSNSILLLDGFLNEQKNSGSREEQLYMMLLSQALTIQENMLF